MLRCPLPLSLLFSHMCMVEFPGEIRCCNRWDAESDVRIQLSSVHWTWKRCKIGKQRLSLFMEYFCFGKGGYFSLKMLFVTMSRWIVI